MARKALLVCGILAPLLYVATDIAAAMLWDGYSYTDQTVSETFAVGAPTRPLVVARGLAYSGLAIAFGLGVWVSVHGQRALRVAGKLLVGLGCVDLLGPFAPMHQREALAAGGGTLSDTLHIALASVDVLLILLIIGFGMHAFARHFRRYSIATMLIVVVFGALAAVDGPRISADMPTPWLGLAERTSIYAFMLWLAVLAIGLLRAQAERPRSHPV